MKGQKTLGFTLIEILVVVSIISLISSIALASLGSARDEAKKARALTEMRQIADAIIVAQGETGTTTQATTYVEGVSLTIFCTDCACRNSYRANEYGLPPVPGNRLWNIGDSDPCYTQLVSALTRIESAGGGVIGIRNLTRDPWGSPYLLDENDGEYMTGPECGPDTLISAGPDGIENEFGPGGPSSVDDFGLTIPRLNPCF